jgi:hypothetical protein
MPVRRRALLAVLVIAAFGALLPVVSASGASSYPTKIVVSLKFPAFHGTLRSAKGACLKSRTVKLYRKKSGPAKLLGTDKSEDSGKWSIPIGKRLTPGSYYATVGAHGKCKAAKSKVNSVD